MASFFQFLINLFRPSLKADIQQSASFNAAAGPGADDADGRVKLALAVISGDTGGQAVAQILEQVKTVPGMGFTRLDKPAPAEKGPDLFGKALRCHTAAHNGAVKAKSDLMLWGELDSESRRAVLRLSSIGSIWAERVAWATVTVEVPDPIPGYLSPLFAVWVYTHALTLTGTADDRSAMQGLLSDWMPKLRSMIRDDGDAVPAAEMASCAAVYAMAALELARDGIRGHVADAAKVVQLATARSVQDADQLKHAGLLALQGDLMVRHALASVGENDLDIAKDSFVRAEEIFRGYGSAMAAAAFCHYGLGRAMVTQAREKDDLGQLVSGMAELRAGVAALASKRDAYQWAMVTAELGRAMAAQAEIEGRKTAFSQAVEVYQAALKVMPRLRLYDWAQLAYSLASAQYLFGRMTADVAPIQEAKTHFEEAAKAFTEYGAHRSARSAEGNLHRCDQAIEEAAARAAAQEAAEAEAAEAAAAAEEDGDGPKG